MSDNAYIRKFEKALTVLRRIATGYPDRSMSDYSRTQLDILTLIDEQANRTVKELAELLAMTSGAITQTVETLVRRGLIHKEQDSQDRRFTRLSLTDAGQDAVGKYYAGRRQLLRAITDELSESEIRTMMRIADKLLPFGNSKAADDRRTSPLHIDTDKE